MALCTLVDENDHIICYKERAKLEPGDIYRITSLWVVNTRHEILLAQRVLAKKKDPGKWGPAVAGTVENQETYDENVIKEACEELGITDTRFTRGPKLYVPDNGHSQAISVKHLSLISTGQPSASDRSLSKLPPLNG